MPLSGSKEFIDMLLERPFLDCNDQVSVMNGCDVNGHSLLSEGFEKPVLIPSKEGLRIRVPPPSFTPMQLLDHVDPLTIVDVIDVREQAEVQLQLKDFIDAFESKSRKTLLNMLSLEFSQSELSKFVSPPHVVSELSLITNCWIDDTCEDHDFEFSSVPSVQKYCLLGMRGSYTDFHIDFGGSSVWYHVLWGEKIFYLVPPTPVNFNTYWNWIWDPSHRDIFFPDRLRNMENGFKEVYRLHLLAGQTVLLPAGWIHAVYTVSDCMVFGGNFLNEVHIPIQLSVYRLEQKSGTPLKFQFPHFEKVHWFAAERLAGRLTNALLDDREPKPYELDAARCLSKTLPHWFEKHRTLDREDRFYFIPQQSVMELSGLDLVKRLSELALAFTSLARRRRFSQTLRSLTGAKKRRVRRSKPHAVELESTSLEKPKDDLKCILQPCSSGPTVGHGLGWVPNRFGRKQSNPEQKTDQPVLDVDNELLEALPELANSRLIGDHYFLSLDDSDDLPIGGEQKTCSGGRQSPGAPSKKSGQSAPENDPTWSVPSPTPRSPGNRGHRRPSDTISRLLSSPKKKMSFQPVFLDDRNLHPLIKDPTSIPGPSGSSYPSSSKPQSISQKKTGRSKAKAPTTVRQRLAKRLGI